MKSVRRLSILLCVVLKSLLLFSQNTAMCEVRFLSFGTFKQTSQFQLKAGIVKQRSAWRILIIITQRKCSQRSTGEHMIQSVNHSINCITDSALSAVTICKSRERSQKCRDCADVTCQLLIQRQSKLDCVSVLSFLQMLDMVAQCIVWRMSHINFEGIDSFSVLTTPCGKNWDSRFWPMAESLCSKHFTSNCRDLRPAIHEGSEHLADISDDWELPLDN